MPFIQPQVVPISFQGGLQSKSDDVQISPDNLLTLENAVFDKIGRLNKRFGYDILSKQIVNGNSINSASAIDIFNNELVLFDNRYIYSYTAQNENWVNRGTAISLINSNTQIIRTSSAQQLNPDSCILDNIEVYAWEDSRGGVRYSVLDSETGAFQVYDNAFTDFSVKPKVISFNGRFYIFYVISNTLFYRTIDPDNPTVITSAVAVASTLYVEAPYDVFVSGGFIWIAIFEDDAPFGQNITVIQRAANGGTATYAIDSGTIVEDNNYTSIAISIDSQDQLWVAWSTGTKVNYRIQDATSPATTILTTTQISTTVSPTLSIIEIPGSPGAMEIFYEVNATDPYNHYTVAAALTATGTITTNATTRSVGLASKAFVHNELIHINLVHESTLQNTYFTVFLDVDKLTVIGKISPQLGGGLSSNGMLPQVNSPETGVFVFANLIKTQFISEDNITVTLLGVNSTKIDFNNPSKFNSAVFSRNLLYVGGIVQSYDGASVVEQNFHIFPENVEANYSTTGGALSVGQYQYQVIYAWTDRFGQIQYSSPSPSVTISSTNATGSCTLTIPTCRLTSKTDVVIKVYRTQVNQVVFQEVTSELSPLQNDPDVDTVEFLDVVADDEMAANQPLYTTGGVNANVAPPSANLIANYQDRIMLAGIDQDRNVIWFSKNKTNNTNFNTIPVEFSAFNVIGVNPAGGPITALATMDDQLIIFKRSSIYVLTGEGPNDAGGGNAFPNVQLVSNSVGCENPNSIVLTKNGLMFQSTKGIWLLPRGLAEPQYIGAGVDTQARTFTVTSATVDPNDNLIIFTTDNGPALVYENLIGQWTTFTNHNAAVDSLPYNNLFAFVKSNGDVYVQNRSSYMDGTKKIKMKIGLPWFSFGQMQGYQSIFRVFLLGEYKGAHQLQVSVAYDFNPAYLPRDIATVDATTLAGSNQWGSSTTWGSDDTWGGEHELYQWQVNFARQKCTSFRLLIEDVQTSDFNEGFTLSNLLIQVGVMGGPNRIPTTKKVSTRNP